jgi:hypothetical protein
MSIIIISLAIAFCWVEFINPFKIKPFNCVKCLTGWIALGLGIALYGWVGIIYLPLGVFTGSIFSAISMRYL